MILNITVKFFVQYAFCPRNITVSNVSKMRNVIYNSQIFFRHYVVFDICNCI